jgi:hypothetical protein
MIGTLWPDRYVAYTMVPAVGGADPYAKAMLTPALEAARLGAGAPLSPDLLRAAASGYCTRPQQAEAPGNWFEQSNLRTVLVPGARSKAVTNRWCRPLAGLFLLADLLLLTAKV